jgi:hypothetical protein
LPDRRHRRTEELAAHAALLERAHQQRAPLVLSDDGGQRAVRAERRDVQRDVRGAARPLLRGTRAHDRDRSLRRDSRGIAEPVLVEHCVAGDEHFELRELWNDQRQESVTGALDRVG